ncbi:hypothetical protein GBN23_02430 [Plesiomonas shigelloides]|uniref:hypothetical protein n=1 Tax=Plesiomonas shigelloides TaxID=703 RepID=UPI0012624FF2|nr:hypothetical protein [Plesiomonas shigelloides]KAB7684630.1 hypothetical protein GBN23_02430 [Plesiomonas shigelloides]
MLRDLDKLIKGAATGAALQEVAPVNEPQMISYRQKKLNRVPLSYFEAHKRLKASGGTSLNFEAYIMEAVRQKLTDDGAI